MRIALVAEAEPRERIRCVRSIASQTSVSALGVGSWDELVMSMEGPGPISLVLYSPPFPGAPEDAIERLQRRAITLVVVVNEAEMPGPTLTGPMRVARPIPEETLILLARRAGTHSAAHRVSYAPADFLQMICMSGDSHVLIVSNGGADTGVIEVRDGRVWTAFDAMGVGEESFARLVRPEMRVRVRPSTPSTKPRTIHKELSELLLDALLRIDEGTVPLPPPLTADQIAEALASPAELAARVKELHASVRRSLMDRKYDDAARLLSRLLELDPGSPIVKANLEQLRKLGYAR